MDWIAKTQLNAWDLTTIESIHMDVGGPEAERRKAAARLHRSKGASRQGRPLPGHSLLAKPVKRQYLTRYPIFPGSPSTGERMS